MRNIMTRHKAVSPAFLVALALAVGVVASATVAASTAGASGSDRHATGWANPSEPANPGVASTLTNDIGQPSGGAESQLPLGFGLLAVGLLALAYGLSRLRAPQRSRGPSATRDVRQALMPRTR